MDRLFFETKIAADDAGAIRGIAWKFGAPDRIGDVIEPGAFKGAVLPLPMLFGHDMGDPVGSWEAATEKADGLHVEGKLLVNDVARAREVFAAMWAGEQQGGPDAIIEARGLRQTSDSGAIAAMIDEVLAAHPAVVDEYRAGKQKAFNSLVGQIMKAAKGKANPQQVNELLKQKLG